MSPTSEDEIQPSRLPASTKSVRSGAVEHAVVRTSSWDPPERSASDRGERVGQKVLASGRRYCDISSPLDDVAFLARSPNRVRLLETLGSGVHTRAELAGATRVAIESDAPPLRAWARATFERHRADATPLSAAFLTADSSHE